MTVKGLRITKKISGLPAWCPGLALGPATTLSPGPAHTPSPTCPAQRSGWRRPCYPSLGQTIYVKFKSDYKMILIMINDGREGFIPVLT
jgi:hypothetical protein